jgi:transposase
MGGLQVVINNLDQIKICIDGALPLLSAICDKINLVNIIDGHIDNDQDNRIISTGKAIKAMVMNIVANRKALYKLTRFYDNTDTQKMFGNDINPEHFTDDVMARALDELYEIGPGKVMTEAAMSIIKIYNIPVSSIHADTTSKSLYGAYESNGDEDEIEITYGHSKDHRPDLKQILFGLGTTKDKIIVIGDVMDGNTSDKQWNKDILKELRNAMKKHGLSDFIYVADSAAITEDMLKELEGNNEGQPSIRFISRLPGTYSLEKELKQKAIDNPAGWEDIGYISKGKDAARYKAQSFTARLYNGTYRFVVYHSSQLDKRKANTIKKDIDREKKILLSAIKDFQRIDFYCEKDAKEAVQKFEKDLHLKYHELVYSIEPLEQAVKRNKPGRPAKKEKPKTRTIYKVRIKPYQDDRRIKETKDKASVFVLITNIIDHKEMDSKAILKEYKDQASVETSFRVLKDPYFIDQLFIKTPYRVEAMAYVMLMALMVLTLLERTIRQNLKSEQERIIVSGNRKTFTPTGLAIIETLEQIQVILIYNREKGKWERHCRLDDNLKRLIRLAGFDESIYTEGFKKIV